MKEIKICFTNPDDVKEFVRAARKCEFDIDLTYQRAVVDAKSILGVLITLFLFPYIVNLLILSSNSWFVPWQFTTRGRSSPSAKTPSMDFASTTAL